MQTNVPFPPNIIAVEFVLLQLICVCLCQEEDSMDDSSDASTQEKPSRKIYYKLQLYPGKWINILYDRLTLLALLDR